MAMRTMFPRWIWFIGFLMVASSTPSSASAEDTLVIATSPSVQRAVKALAREFETTRRGVKVLLYVDSALDLHRTVASTENRDHTYVIGRGPIHLLAPGGDEVIAQLERKGYILPTTRTPYAAVSLALVVPATAPNVPRSFDEMARGACPRLTVADPERSVLGEMTAKLLKGLDLQEKLKYRVNVAADVRGVVDYLISGATDCAVLFSPEVFEHPDKLRVAAIAPRGMVLPILHSMAIQHYSPDRLLAEQFLSFIRTREARMTLAGLGYQAPSDHTPE